MNAATTQLGTKVPGEEGEVVLKVVKFEFADGLGMELPDGKESFDAVRRFELDGCGTLFGTG
jgi:hypothetical protein